MSAQQQALAQIAQQAQIAVFGPNGTHPLGEVKANGVVYPRGFQKGFASLGQFVVNGFNKFRDSTFVVYENERLTYGDVDKLSNELAWYLANNLGVRPGDRVAIAMRNYPEWIIAFLAAVRFGAVAVPLNSWWTGPELEYGLKDSGSTVFICDEERLSSVLPFYQKAGFRTIVTRNAKPLPKDVTSWSTVLKQAAGRVSPAEAKVELDDNVCIMYTSGTTGNPKGVVLTHRGVLSQMMMASAGVEMKERILAAAKLPPDAPQCIICPVPLFHVTASHHIFLACLVNGRKLVLMFKWDAGRALELIEREKATGWTGVPTMVADMMEHPDFAKRDLSSLKAVGGGGGPTPPSQVARTNARFGGGKAHQGYGLTETNGAVCTNSAEAYAAKPTSTGKAFPIVEFKVVDLDTGAVLPAGQRGELLIKSPLNMKGYWNKPDATNEVLSADGWFRSGDVAMLDQDGDVFILDRAKDLVIKGGENISCAEVEAAVYSHPSVHECAVFALPDERLGEKPGLMIYLKRGEAAVPPADFVALLKPKIANFKIPFVTDIFFTNEPLPRGATGKIHKRTIKENLKQQLQSKL